jgi:glycosyltransferase involved in cell wall biosynthesis
MSDLRKIFIVCFTGDSGITHYSISLARELSGHAQVSLVVGKNYGEQGYPPANFEVLRLFRRSRWYPQDLMRLFWRIVRRRPRVVLFQSVLKSAGAEAVLVRLIRLFGIETAMTIHDVLPHYPKPWSRWTHAWLYRAFDRLIVHSHRSRGDVRTMGVHRPALVVPHGLYDLFVTRPPAREAAREKLTAFAKEHFVLLFFGKIDSRKGIGLFLQLRQAPKE